MIKLNKIFYITILIFCLFGCKNTEQTNLSNNDTDSNLKKEGKITTKTSNVKNQITCISDIFIEGPIPTFGFDDAYKNKRATFLLDTLFSNFYISHIKPIKNTDRNYLKASKYFSPSENIETLKTKENSYSFFIGLDSINLKNNNTVILEYAELNFPTNHYKNVNRELFKIKKDSSLIDIGMTKKEFANIFKKDVKQLCDTIFVGNETDESYYIFNDNQLAKVIFNFYTP